MIYKVLETKESEDDMLIALELEAKAQIKSCCFMLQAVGIAYLFFCLMEMSPAGGGRYKY